VFDQSMFDASAYVEEGEMVAHDEQAPCKKATDMMSTRVS